MDDVKEHAQHLALDLDVSGQLKRTSYVFVPAAKLLLTGKADDLAGFSEFWADLPADRYLPGGGGYRFRRYSTFAVDSLRHTVSQLPAAAFYQSREVNSFAGGMERVFAPLQPQAASHPTLLALIMRNVLELARLGAGHAGMWRVNVHMIRITGSTDSPGLPTPEGIHRDETDYSSIHLIRRSDVIGGETSIYTTDHVEIGRFVMTEPLDSCYFVDTEILHAVEQITALPGVHAVRDMLLFGYFRPNGV